MDKNKNIINQNENIQLLMHVLISLEHDYLLISDSVKAGSFNFLGVVMQAHVPQHHDRAEQQGGGIGHVFSCYIWGSSMNLIWDINHGWHFYKHQIS